MMLSVNVMASGYCTAHRRVEDPGSIGGTRKFYATWLVIRHPSLGVVLFDTGYGQQVFQAGARFPDRFHLWATPVTLQPHETAAAQLAAAGISAADVSHIIISHFHVDHIGGLRDFPAARLYAASSAYEQAQKLQGIAAVRRGILKGLLPDDLKERFTSIEECSTTYVDADSGLTFYRDFLGQQDLTPVHLPGHACGMLGLYVPSHRMLFASDAAWSADTFRRGVLPRQVVRLFFDSWSEFVETQERMRTFMRANPDVEVLFTHCPETMALVSRA